MNCLPRPGPCSCGGVEECSVARGAEQLWSGMPPTLARCDWYCKENQILSEGFCQKNDPLQQVDLGFNYEDIEVYDQNLIKKDIDASRGSFMQDKLPVRKFHFFQQKYDFLLFTFFGMTWSEVEHESGLRPLLCKYHYHYCDFKIDILIEIYYVTNIKLS